MWGYGHGWGMGWGMGFGFIFWLVILGVIVGAWCGLSVPNRLRAASDVPLVLRCLRSARGEINQEEYLQKKRDILG